MSGQSFSNPGSAVGTLLAGVSVFAIAHGLPGWMGMTPDPGTDFFLTLVKGLGAFGVLGGLIGLQGLWSTSERRKVSGQTSGVFGTAAFATAAECEARSLFDPNGLYLGIVHDDGEALPLFHNGKAHLLTCAPARQGKGINVVIPNLLHYSGSVVVTDPKGELAAVTSAHRRERMGHDVAVFNPWALHDLPHARINPLEPLITMAGDLALQRGLVDEVSANSLQLLPEPEDTRNGHFRIASRGLMDAGQLYLALHKPELCTLPELYRLVSSRTRLVAMAEEMQESEALGRLLVDLGTNLADQMRNNPEQFEDFRTGAVNALSIHKPGSFLGEAVSASDIALSDLKGGKLSLYLAFPPDKIGTHGSVLGLIVTQAINAVSRSKRDGSVLFLLDEFANLGKLSGLAESLTTLPGLGVRVWMIVQELAEVTRLYGPHTAQTIQSQAEVKQFFAVNGDELAQSLSKALGQRTVKTHNYNLGKTAADEIGESLSETGQPLMRPEDIKAMGESEQLLLIKGLSPIFAGRVPFWFAAPWGAWAAPNPVEGDYPQPKPLFELEYELEGKDDE